MGIDTSWKKILEERYPECFSSGLPEGVMPVMVIDDLSLNLRKFTHLAKTGKEILERLSKRLNSFYNPNLETYVGLFDEPRHVPPCKQKTQKKRIDNCADAPYTADEISRFKISIQDHMLPNMGRLLATKSLHPEVYRYLTAGIIDWKIPESNGPKKLKRKIDGGIVRSLNMDNMSLEPRLIVCSPYTTQPFTCDTYCIGEAEQKAPKYVSDIKEGPILVSCYDTDILPILLLNARDWIDLETKDIKVDVYVDLTHQGSGTHLPGPARDDSADHNSDILDRPSKKAATTSTSGGNRPVNAPNGDKKKKAPVRKIMVNVVALWRAIIDDFNVTMPNIKNPIEVVVLLMAMCGGDFVDNLPGVGAITMWNAFLEFGNKIMYMKEPILVPDDVITNDRDFPHNIVLAEHKVYQWIVLVYYQLLTNATTRTIDIKKFDMSKTASNGQDHLSNTMKEVRRLAPSNAKIKSIQSDQKLMAYIRRVYWTMDYWSNGSKPRKYFTPHEVDPVSGLSKYGWTKQKSWEEGVEKLVCMPVDCVHVYARNI